MLSTRASQLLLLLAAASFQARDLRAQATDTRRVEATRPELEAELVEIEKIVNSPGYSGRLRAAKRAEADLVRQRLVDGDLQVGDQINLTVVGEQALTATFTVAPGRVLILPGYPEIPLKGVLRAEVPGYLSQELKKYIRDPQVHTQTMIRLSIFGAVGKPGFYQVAADQLAGEAIMTAAGGPAGNADPHKTTVRRGGVEIWSKEAFQQALVEGVTLDRLNLRAGDEIIVSERKHINVRNYIYFVTGVSSLYFLLSRVF
jgi:protein involved in polysaccharide export with SLBB domain